MKRISISDFSEISYDSSSDALLIKWFNENQCMSETEFHNQLYMIFDAIKTFKTDTIIIDAYFFKYPILESSINLIRNFLSEHTLKKCVLVQSRYLLGNKGIQRLISKLMMYPVELNIVSAKI